MYGQACIESRSSPVFTPLCQIAASTLLTIPDIRCSMSRIHTEDPAIQLETTSTIHLVRAIKLWK